jgi:alkylhydroperoxidase/carboxymuconolactone decarboxylase family protein YurZ
VLLRVGANPWNSGVLPLKEVEEMEAAGVKAAGGPKPDTRACGAMRAIGQWNTAWDPFYNLSPLWTDEFFAFGASVYKSGIFSPRFMELISIAFDASITHMYAPGVRPHIRGALKAGAKPEEVMAVLQICVSMGVQACVMGVPILACPDINVIGTAGRRRDH